MPNYCLQDEFHNGFALVQDAETYKYGFINEQNEEIIPCMYDYGYNFNSKSANATTIIEIHGELGRKMGVINTKNELLVPAEYDFVTNVNEDFYITQTGSDDETTMYSFYVPSSKFLMPLSYPEQPRLLHNTDHTFQYFACKMDNQGLWGFLDFQGKEILPFVYDDHYFEEDLYLLFVRKGEFHQVFDKNFKPITPENIYKRADLISDYPFFIHNISPKNLPFIRVINSDEKQGLLDLQGNIVLDCIYPEILRIYPEKNHFLVTQDNEYFLIDHNNNVASPRKYPFIGALYNRDVLVYSEFSDSSGKNFRCGLMTANFEILTEAIFCDSPTHLSENMLNTNTVVSTRENVDSETKMGVYDFKQKKLVIPCEYSEISSLNVSYILVKKDNLYGLYNANYEPVVSPKYKNIEIVYDFGEAEYDYQKTYPTLGYVVENGEGKKGILDLKQNVIVPFAYDNIHPTYNKATNTFVVEKIHFFNQKGLVESPIFAQLKARMYGGYGCDGLGQVEGTNGLYGFINANFELVIPCVYDDILGFSEGLSIVKNHEKYGVVNTKNEVIVPFDYDFAYPNIYKGGDIFLVLSNQEEKHTIFDNKGNKIHEYPYTIQYKNMGMINFNDPENGQKNTLKNLHTGKSIILEENFEVQEFCHSVALLVNQSEYPYKYKFIDTNCNTPFVLDFEVEEASDFSMGIAHIKATIQEGQDFRTHVFINPKGEIITKQSHSDMRYICDNVYAFMDNNGWGLKDAKGNLLVEEGFSDEFRYYAPNKIILRKDVAESVNIEYYLYDISTKTIRNLPYIISYQAELYQENGKDFLGVWQYNPTEFAKDNLVPEYGFMDLEGNITIPLDYQETCPFKFGLATVKKGNFWGVINTKNEVIVPFEYTESLDFNGVFGRLSQQVEIKVNF